MSESYHVLDPLRETDRDIAPLRPGPIMARGRRRILRRRMAAMAVAIAGVTATATLVEFDLPSSRQQVVVATASQTEGQPLPRPDVNQQLIEGQSYEYQLYGHCGIDWIKLSGSWWRAATPINESGAPSLIRGTIVLQSDGTLWFRGEGNFDILFRPVSDEPEARCA